jgi:glutathione synthase/RimK-type ligase-like ATP-grasp enzyme
MRATVLVLGDDLDWDSYKKFCKQVQKHRSKKLNWVTVTYDLFEKNEFPLIDSDTVIIFLFFPVIFWDKHIEKEGYKGVYGNVEFYHKFVSFWSEIYITLKRVYRDKKVYFINHPLKIAIDRDKELTKTILSENGIRVPLSYYTRNYKDILELVEQENKKLFLKVRYGSMGKGITYIEKGNWKTNFRFEGGKILSPYSNYGWTFVDITDNVEFLNEISTKDIVIEEAIEPCELNDIRFDLRLYVFSNKVLYIYPRTNKKNAITANISQGGQGRSTQFLKRLPKNVIDKAVQSAIKTVRAMDVNFAGVDVMISKDFKIYVIELNTFPGFPKAHRFNLSKRIIQHIEKGKWK